MKNLPKKVGLTAVLLATSLVVATAVYSLTESPYLFGDWGGARTELAEAGVTLDIYHIFDVYDDYSDASVAAGGGSADAEYTIELAYKVAVTPWLIIQPDFQIVIDPSGDDSRDPVWIAGLRTIVQF